MTLSDLGIFSLIDEIELSEKTKTSGLGSMTKINDPQPVKFNQGGAVQRFVNGGNPQFASEVPFYDAVDLLTPEELNQLQSSLTGGNTSTVPDLKSLYKDKSQEYRDILYDEQDFEKKRDLTQAQMLFDIAQAGLTFAAPMKDEPSGLSPAGRAALALSSSQLFPKIGERASILEKEKQEMEQKIGVAALSAAESEKIAAIKAIEDRKLQEQDWKEKKLLEKLKISEKQKNVRYSLLKENDDGTAYEPIPGATNLTLDQLTAAMKENPGALTHQIGKRWPTIAQKTAGKTYRVTTTEGDRFFKTEGEAIAFQEKQISSGHSASKIFEVGKEGTPTAGKVWKVITKDGGLIKTFTSAKEASEFVNNNKQLNADIIEVTGTIDKPTTYKGRVYHENDPTGEIYYPTTEREFKALEKRLKTEFGDAGLKVEDIPKAEVEKFSDNQQATFTINGEKKFAYLNNRQIEELKRTGIVPIGQFKGQRIGEIVDLKKLPTKSEEGSQPVDWNTITFTYKDGEHDGITYNANDPESPRTKAAMNILNNSTYNGQVVGGVSSVSTENKDSLKTFMLIGADDERITINSFNNGYTDIDTPNVVYKIVDPKTEQGADKLASPAGANKDSQGREIVYVEQKIPVGEDLVADKAEEARLKNTARHQKAYYQMRQLADATGLDDYKLASFTKDGKQVYARYYIGSESDMDKYNADRVNETFKEQSVKEFLQADEGLYNLSDAELRGIHERGLITDEDIKTGLWNKIASIVSATVGQVTPQWLFGGLDAVEIEAGKQKLRIFRQIAKSAFIRSPRFPVYELGQVLELMPDPDAWGENPVVAIRKMKVLKEKALEYIVQNYATIAEGGSDAERAISSNRELILLYNSLKKISTAGEFAASAKTAEETSEFLKLRKVK